MASILWAGDSTVQFNDCNTYPQTGIGQVFHLFAKEEVQIRNHAKNGRSTKSFLDQGRFAAMVEEMQPGDLLFIQFGHNDEKKEDPDRYTQPSGTFSDNLRCMIQTAKEKGVYPVLISPIERRNFETEHKLRPSAHLPYVEAEAIVAKTENVPMIDLCAMSHAALEELGEENSRKLHMFFEPAIYPNFPDGKEDNTHLRYEGAVLYAGMIAKALKELGDPYANFLR